MPPFDLTLASGISPYLPLWPAVTPGIFESAARLGRVSPVGVVSRHNRWMLLFALGFVAVRAVSLALDAYAGVPLAAVFVLGLAPYRSLTVARSTPGLLAGSTAWSPPASRRWGCVFTAPEA